MKTMLKQLTVACGVVLASSSLGLAAQVTPAPKAAGAPTAVSGTNAGQTDTGAAATTKKHRKHHKKGGKSKAATAASGTTAPGNK
jgi:hypothetical protein